MAWRKRPLVAGAAALFAAGIANRIIGTVYRVLLVRTAGEEIIGLFQMTMPIYRLAWMLATAGLPVAIARLTADAYGSGRPQAAHRHGRVGVGLSIFSAAAASMVLLATQPLWAHRFLTDARTDITLLVLPLILFPSALSASLRGILQGRELLIPAAWSGLTEAISRVPAVLALVVLLLPAGPRWAAAGIAVGLAFGEVVSLAYLTWIVRRGDHLPRTRRPSPVALSSSPSTQKRRSARFSFASFPVVTALAATAAPLLIAGLVNSALGMINVALIPRSLAQAGMTPGQATALYGRLFGMALPTLYMPMVAIHPLVHAAVPAVAKRLAQGRADSVKALLKKCFAVTGIVSVAASIVFWTYGEHIGVLLYGVDGLGALIAPLAIAAPFAYLDHVSAGILYGMGRTGIALFNSVAGSLLRIALIVTLVNNPAYGIVGALWAVVADFGLTALLHTAALGFFVPRALGRTR